MGWIQMVRDWTAVRKMKEGLLDALRQTPPGAGISIENPNDPIVSRAVIELLKEHPNDLEALDSGFSLNLMRKIAMVQSMKAETYAELRAKHDILTADSIVQLNLGGKEQLPTRRWRDGVNEAEVNGDPNRDPFEVIDEKRKRGINVR